MCAPRGNQITTSRYENERERLAKQNLLLFESGVQGNLREIVIKCNLINETLVVKCTFPEGELFGCVRGYVCRGQVSPDVCVSECLFNQEVGVFSFLPLNTRSPIFRLSKISKIFFLLSNTP